MRALRGHVVRGVTRVLRHVGTGDILDNAARILNYKQLLRLVAFYAIKW